MDTNLRKQSIISHNLKYLFEKKDKKWSLREIWRQWDKYVYTLLILVMYFNYGLVVSVFPPAMVDMKYMFGTSMSLINYVNTFNSLGYMIGSLGGFLYVYINRQLTFVVLCALLAVLTAVMPLCTSLWQLYLCAVVSQLGVGAFDSGNSMWVVEMWQRTSGPVLQVSKATYGFGTIVAPLLAKPYLFGELDVNNSTDLNVTHVMTKEELNLSIERRDHIKIPFLIAGAVTLSVPIVWTIMFVFKRYKEPGTEAKKKMSQQLESFEFEAEEERDLIEGSPKLKWLLVGLISVCLSTFAGLELIHFYYCPTFLQMLPIRLSVKKAADIMSMMSSTYTAGKLVSAFIAIKVKPHFMIIYHFVFLAIALAVLYFGQNSELMLWIGNGLMGLGLSAVWPCFLSYAENCFGLSNKISSIFSFFSSICPIISPFICGPLIEEHPIVFIIAELVYLACTIILFALILFIVHRSKMSSNAQNKDIVVVKM